MKLWRRLLTKNRGVRRLKLDYRVRVRPRYGYGSPAHPGLWERIAAGRADYAALLSGIAALAPTLGAIPATTADPSEPRWENRFFPPLDGISLYGLLALRRPRLYVEVGSGDSTRFARRAIRDFGLSTRILSIDPEPRTEIDALCDEVVRTPFEDAGPGVFADLRAGDVVFHDGSHRVFQNSDAVVTFLEVLPTLPSGVALGVHDVYLPWDYPPAWGRRYYSEQYLLAAYLLADCPWLQVLLPNHFITHDEELLGKLAALGGSAGLTGRPLHGEAFWLEVRR
jgi:hypothetical protein